MQTTNKRKDLNEMTTVSSEESKKIMSELRGGDYQHAGEEEAIDLVFDAVLNKGTEYITLDVGCGLGGTANYIHQKRLGSVIGIDINKNLIDAAMNKYSEPYDIEVKNVFKFIQDNPLFLNVDVENLSGYMNKKFKDIVKFDNIFIFNAFFLFEHQDIALSELKKQSKLDSDLYLFDYVDYGDYEEIAYYENNNKILPNCIKLKDIDQLFNNSGWRIFRMINLDDKYLSWYQNLLNKMHINKSRFYKKYGKVAFDTLQLRYEHLYEAIKYRKIGGAIIHAKPI